MNNNINRTEWIWGWQGASSTWWGQCVSTLPPDAMYH